MKTLRKAKLDKNFCNFIITTEGIIKLHQIKLANERHSNAIDFAKLKTTKKKNLLAKDDGELENQNRLQTFIKKKLLNK